MRLNDIYIYALQELNGFDEESVERAIELANNDVVETVEEFIDFINFNIEDEKFPNITQPYSEKAIRKVVEKARKNESKIIRHVYVTEGGYPQKLMRAQIGTLAPIAYKGNLKNLDRKTIMITGPSSITNNAKMASKYFGKMFASNGYNILTTLSEGCEQYAINGCTEASGISTFFLPHCLERMSTFEKRIVQKELESGKSVVLSANTTQKADDDSVEDAFRYLSALADCLIVPQISIVDGILRLVQKCLAANKPVFLIKYKAGDDREYDCTSFLESLGAKYLSSNTALEQIKNAIGEAEDDWN